MTNSLSADKDFDLWLLLRQTKDMVLKAVQKELSQYGISPEVAAVLSVVQFLGDKATPAEISRWLLRKQHTVTELLSRMEKKGLVRKTKDLERKNMIRVSLTEKGQQAYYQSSEIKCIRQLMSSLSEEERKQLRPCLEKLRDRALKQIGIEQKPPFPEPR